MRFVFVWSLMVGFTAGVLGCSPDLTTAVPESNTGLSSDGVSSSTAGKLRHFDSKFIRVKTFSRRAGQNERVLLTSDQLSAKYDASRGRLRLSAPSSVAKRCTSTSAGSGVEYVGECMRGNQQWNPNDTSDVAMIESAVNLGVSLAGETSGAMVGIPDTMDVGVERYYDNSISEDSLLVGIAFDKTGSYAGVVLESTTLDTLTFASEFSFTGSTLTSVTYTVANVHGDSLFMTVDPEAFDCSLTQSCMLATAGANQTADCWALFGEMLKHGGAFAGSVLSMGWLGAPIKTGGFLARIAAKAGYASEGKRIMQAARAVHKMPATFRLAGGVGLAFGEATGYSAYWDAAGNWTSTCWS